MPLGLIIFCMVAVAFRVAMLVVSLRHEAALKREGAVEIGARNTAILALAHIAFYISAMTEGAFQAHPIDAAFWIGVILYTIGVVALVVVVRLLGPLWTVKLLIAREHVLVTHALFRWVRHPNYFLNILPELIGFALLMNAPLTLAAGLPFYAIPLIIRIVQEEAAMRSRFSAY
ncbi:MULTISPECIES: isoprenylcysteine carboxylmethyltransferase family protein [unclassified Rhizobium]|uniref:isoprenylcysteine carboxylmethyltransferase family protein n=1 Tax=unclassified Rhizobium TaxID=2613769 RepID=UPI001ADAA181|nr:MULTISPECIES: isoprenylcysteine carboxylmethyltransferase family protein [unclassified Rhizobium]MBO9097683.1 hypothetical protein [Rhizobium sp. L58/93]MBO9133533.1 hypothetical protein [Rhizobium sp. B209b/85]MBO9167833.1 hypothetical protein [Rhizobium sp. L245/93]MBO9183878.1 hypothetical protein [Rhizobium sp. E27B/91]QXZ84120.1 hypothetical protein J5287_00680 [Rhizobium sp. K1/93]